MALQKKNPGRTSGGFFQGLSGFFSTFGGSSFVGLSIGSSCIKIVEIAKYKKAYKLIHFGVLQLPEDVIVNREIVNQIALVESLKTLLSQMKLRSKMVCSSLSGTSLIIKRMSLEVQNMREIQDQVFWEAEQYLPFDVSEVVMDFDIVSKTKDNKVDLILVAVKKSVLESYMDCIVDAGLKVKVMDVDFFALQTIFEFTYPISPSEAAAIVDIGACSMKMVVSQNGVPVFTKDSSVGGKNLTVEIQKHLNLSYVDAEALKLGEQGGNFPQEVNDLMQVASEGFAAEIKRSIDFYNASSSSAPISYIVLAGGSAKIPGLAKAIEDLVKISTQLINPFNSIVYDTKVFSSEYLNAISALSAVPLGLALRAAKSD